MDGSQIFEPAFGKMAKGSRAAGASVRASTAEREFPRTCVRTAAGTGRGLFFSLLELLDICRAPRIISVECLAGKPRYIPAGAAPSMDEAGILTDLAV